jgi:hypothetical protein
MGACVAGRARLMCVCWKVYVCVPVPVPVCLVEGRDRSVRGQMGHNAHVCVQICGRRTCGCVWVGVW